MSNTDTPDDDPIPDALRAHDFDASAAYRPAGAVYVADVWQNSYDDVRLGLDGDTYEAFTEDGVKDALEWDDDAENDIAGTHHKFNERGNKHWHVDATAIAQVHEALAAEGYALLEDASGYDDTDTDSASTGPTTLPDDAAESGHVTVTYETKQSGTEKQVAGEIVAVDHERDRLAFARDGDNHTMRVKTDDQDDGLALFTSGSSYPFMGPVTDLDVQ